jgi:hypothetical protein
MRDIAIQLANCLPLLQLNRKASHSETEGDVAVTLNTQMGHRLA